jgi:signal transduction histidine kinase
MIALRVTGRAHAEGRRRYMEGSRAANTEPASTRAIGGRSATRPTLWRLPLIAFLAIGVLCLKYLDGRLATDYRRSAADLAVQADALIERAVEYHAASLHTLGLLIADAASVADRQSRLASVGRAVTGASSDVIAVYRLDERGDVADAYPDAERRGDLARENHFLVAEAADAIERARATGAPATTGVIVLRSDTLGLLVYNPVVVRDRVTGYVASAIAYAPMLRELLEPRLQGRFGYRITDGAGRVLAVSPGYPSRVGEFATRTVTLPGGREWRLDVPVGLFQPRAARVTMWIVGIVLLFVVFLLVLREDARAERIAMHSFNLELVSRDLLDANVRLEERAQQVTEANMAKSRFLANVSHELRTPLNAIVGYNALALSGLYGEITNEQRGAHDRIRTSAEHLLRLVNDVLDLSKIEVGRMEVDVSDVSLEPLLEEVVSVVEPVAEAKGVRIDMVVARDLPVIATDARHVKQILLNLATNAIKFTERGSVTIVGKRGESDDPSHAVVVAVEDTGIGIPEADLARIFDEFEQVRPGGRGDSLVRGTGLGLTVARKLARLLGGDVTAESHVGAGSRFTLLLPANPPATASSTDTESERTRPLPAGPPGAEQGAVEAGQRP